MEVKPLTKIIYRGKEVTYNELKPTSQIKFDIECPSCKKIYSTCKQNLESKNSLECQSCSMHTHFSKPLEIGSVYNYWTVIKESKKRNYYSCRCKCGNTRDIEGTIIRSGQSKSCGCLRREMKKNKEPEDQDPADFLKNNSEIDLVEPIVFRGHYKNYDDISPKSHIRFKIRCSHCKLEFITSKYQIVSNKHSMCQKCAMNTRFSKNLAEGEKFGRWIIVRKSNEPGKSICKCKCGALKEVDNYSLTSGSSKSCGCLNKDLARERAYETFREIWKMNRGVRIDKDPRTTRGYTYWREFIMSRDKNKCVRCGSNEKLCSHHIIAIKSDPGLALDPKNGITLCRNCHIQLHNRYKISADRIATNSFIQEINNDFDLDVQTNKYPYIQDISIGTRKAYNLTELF